MLPLVGKKGAGARSEKAFDSQMAKKKVKKPEKSGKKLVQQREHAKRLYIENMGDITDTVLAKETGVNRNTVGKWRKDDGWAAQVEEIKQRAGKKVAEKQAKKVAEQADAIFNELSATNRLVALAARRKMMVLDPSGRPVLDSNGLPMTNDKLSSSELRSLAATMTDCQRFFRLQFGQHTEITKNDVSGEVSAKVDDQFDKAIEKIMKTGDEEAQAELVKMMQSRQKIMAAGGGNE